MSELNPPFQNARGKSLKRRIALKQAAVINELNETVQTLSSIQQVLSDIASLTDPSTCDCASALVVNQANPLLCDHTSEESVAQKVNRLVRELENWEDIQIQGNLK